MILKNNYKLDNKNILFVSPEITWNLYCGNSIWASGFLDMLTTKYNCKITALECLKYNNISPKNIFINNNKLITFQNIFTNNNFNRFISGVDMIKMNILADLIINRSADFNYIIIRSIDLMNYLINIFKHLENKQKMLVKLLKKKIIYVVVDRQEEEKFIYKLVNTLHMTLVKYYNDKIKYPNIPQYIIPPLLKNKSIYSQNFEIKNPQYDFCIVGTLGKRSFIEQILPNFKNSKYNLIISGKIQKLWLNDYEHLKKEYKKYSNIILEATEIGISEQESNSIILNSKFGIRIDKNVECLSSKVLNYICYNRVLIVQRLKTHELLLTKNYPFYLDIDPQKANKSFKEIIPKITANNIALALELVDNAKQKLNIDLLLKNNFTMN